MPTDKFEQMINDYYHARMDTLRQTFHRQGYLLARSEHDHGYEILLTERDGEYNVHSLSDGEPVGHRDYDRLEGGSPVQNALAEFAGADWKLQVRHG